MADFPSLVRGQHLSDQQREEIGGRLRALYEEGESIRQLCTRTGYSIGRVRRLLESAGVEYRARGGPTARKRSV